MSRGRKIALAALAVFALGLGAAYFGWVVPTSKAVDIGAAMLAKQICSCVYVANRDVEECRADQFASMDPIHVEVLRETERVRAWITGLGERTAIHRAGLGCTLE